MQKKQEFALYWFCAENTLEYRFQYRTRDVCPLNFFFWQQSIQTRVFPVTLQFHHNSLFTFYKVASTKWFHLQYSKAHIVTIDRLIYVI